MAEPTDESTDTSAGDSATVRIAAAPERVYEIVTDIANMGRLSPECTGGRWLAGATRPAVGARFKGTNKRGWMRWSTTNEVVAAEPGRRFGFETKQSGARWSYLLEPDDDGTLVTETRTMWRDRPLPASIALKLFLGGTATHEQEMRDGIGATLDRLKAVAES